MSFSLFNRYDSRLFKKSLYTILWMVLVLLFCSTAYSKTEDHCWRTAQPSQLKSANPEVFLASMLEELREMRRNFPETTEEDRNVIISGQSSPELEVKYAIDMFIRGFLETLNYQRNAEEGDILGYLYMVNEIQKSMSEEVVTSFMMAENFGIGGMAKGSMSSYIKNAGAPFLLSLNRHILLCIIPKNIR